MGDVILTMKDIDKSFIVKITSPIVSSSLSISSFYVLQKRRHIQLRLR